MFYDTNRGVTFAFTPEGAPLPKRAEFQVTFESGVQAIAYKPEPPSPYSRRKLQVHPRVYGALDALAPEEMAKEPHKGYAIPITDRTEAEEQMAKEWAAWKRVTLKAAKAELIRLLAAVLDEDIAPRQITFSIHAGCTCPCSPGFIVKDVDGLRNLDSIRFTAAKSE